MSVDSTHSKFRNTHPPQGLVDLDVHFTWLKSKWQTKRRLKAVIEDYHRPQGLCKTSLLQRAWLCSPTDLCLPRAGETQEAAGGQQDACNALTCARQYAYEFALLHSLFLFNLSVCFSSFHASVKARKERDYLLSQAP